MLNYHFTEKLLGLEDAIVKICSWSEYFHHRCGYGTKNSHLPLLQFPDFQSA